jgi:hypothetical protein
LKLFEFEVGKISKFSDLGGVFDITFLKIGEEFRKTNFLKSFIHISAIRF